METIVISHLAVVGGVTVLAFALGTIALFLNFLVNAIGGFIDRVRYDRHKQFLLNRLDYYDRTLGDEFPMAADVLEELRRGVETGAWGDSEPLRRHLRRKYGQAEPS